MVVLLFRPLSSARHSSRCAVFNPSFISQYRRAFFNPLFFSPCRCAVLNPSSSRRAAASVKLWVLFLRRRKKLAFETVWGPVLLLD
ncbi:hypothetical protein L195_g043393 [Trifolium pratense]|uniref:Uncharacterized protein n=1 Tax=Trifolium pratense TaxID=57577 RepID=A0A2K3M949_TRIPR|nr:hypothetical protein L195_g043393 [Trifolium pratense]